MRLLVLGGTRFLGRGVAAAGLAAGAEVTTFTRGVSGSPPDGVEALHGDRETAEGLALLRDRDWDIVVDTSGYLPRAATGSDATFTWVPDDFLVVQGVTPWTELPLWSPATRAPALWDQDTSAAEAAGLRCRPVADTVTDVAVWLREGTGTPPGGRYRESPGLAPDREAELLAAWREQAA